jgi:hypothetical protein
MNGRKASLIVKCENCKGYRYALHDVCHRCGHQKPKIAAAPQKRKVRGRLVVPALTNRDASFVYLISDGTFSKIGFAKNLASRLAALQNATPYELQLVASVETCEPRALEAFLHGLFARKHHRNEWFTHISPPEWSSKLAHALALLDEQREYLRLVAAS